MSIVDSAREQETARARLAEASADRLRLDLEFWSLASADASGDFQAAHARMVEARLANEVASTWITLVTAELRRRRDARAGDVPRETVDGVWP